MRFNPKELKILSKSLLLIPIETQTLGELTFCILHILYTVQHS
jgi:hypothetical protein